MTDVALYEFFNKANDYRYPYCALEDGGLWINRQLWEDLFREHIPRDRETRFVRTEPGRQHRFVLLTSADLERILELADRIDYLSIGGTTVGAEVVRQLVALFPEEQVERPERAEPKREKTKPRKRLLRRERVG